ncbi:MAG: pyruvate, phosphate dikinase [Firmicutes bacterium]|nr:pyruvate, phosphate dikinase [Bacillota bacterium]
MLKTEKIVYAFSEGSGELKSLLGGKGAGLAEITRLGLPVPPGFIITTAACRKYFESGNRIWPELEHEIRAALAALERQTGRKFGDDTGIPLLLSVRSGAVISMPGMMDTILNLGLNHLSVESLAAETANRRFALDCYRRFIQMFAEVVLKIEHHRFESILEEAKKRQKVSLDSELDEQSLQQVVESYLALVEQETGQGFPSSPVEQLIYAIKAVFESWNTPRAKVYRQVNRIPDDLGTAVNVQVMVFGNLSADSGTGVAFTRNPSTGENRLYGEYLLNAQGEDVVAGVRTPQSLERLAQEMPDIYKQFQEACRTLEEHYRDMQDIEFTIERGKLYLLQTRTGKRTATAAVKIAVDLVKEDLISREEALLRIEPAQLEQLLHQRIDPRVVLNVLARGLPASPGAATGKIVFSADRAQAAAGEGERVLLVRPETTPDDIHGIIAAQGILTSRGGMTSHAAVVARGMGKPCVCGCEQVNIDLTRRVMVLGEREFPEGELISIDGSTGKVILGETPLIEPSLTSEFRELLGWADQRRRLAVRANADNPSDARKALELGAEGIGLCRTEHMFTSPESLPLVQQMILAANSRERNLALEKLLPRQREDFKGILKEMAGFPVTIRLLDPPLHEFLPNREDLALEVNRLKWQGADRGKIHPKETLLQKARSLAELNPMLGHRGCRLGLAYPEIYRMQIRAIFSAAAELLAEGFPPDKIRLEVMIPLVGHLPELIGLRALIEQTAKEILESNGYHLDYLIGTMVELPRACLIADQLATQAGFFSFGTNDLTQTTLGYSRDDAEAKFLPFYLQQKILPQNPFMEIDREGVGALVNMAIEKARRVRPDIELGVCGEHGGDPHSIEFFHQVGLDYVSCSPYRLPVARLAAAQAAIKKQKK